MENFTLQRIKQFLDSEKLSVNAFAKGIEMNQATVNNYFVCSRKLSFEFIDAILEHYPNLSAEWLLRGVGEMYLSDNVATDYGNDTEKARQQDGNELRHLQEKIALLEQNNADLRELAAAKKETIATLQDELADLKKARTSALPPTALTA